MKPILTFTEYFEELSNKDFQIEVVATLNGTTPLKAVTGLRSGVTYDNDKLGSVYREGLQLIAMSSMIELRKTDKNFPNPSGMLLMDMLSLFEIRRTVDYINSTVKHNRDDTVLLAAIW